MTPLIQRIPSKETACWLQRHTLNSATTWTNNQPLFLQATGRTSFTDFRVAPARITDISMQPQALSARWHVLQVPGVMLMKPRVRFCFGNISSCSIHQCTKPGALVETASLMHSSHCTAKIGMCVT
eukprot:6036245-Amphidinium_carterae.1